MFVAASSLSCEETFGPLQHYGFRPTEVIGCLCNNLGSRFDRLGVRHRQGMDSCTPLSSRQTFSRSAWSAPGFPALFTQRGRRQRFR